MHDIVLPWLDGSTAEAKQICTLAGSQPSIGICRFSQCEPGRGRAGPGGSVVGPDSLDGGLQVVCGEVLGWVPTAKARGNRPWGKCTGENWFPDVPFARTPAGNQWMRQ